MLTPTHEQVYHNNGYVVIAGLFSPDEVARLLDHYMTLRRAILAEINLKGA